jgi:hypothetical protein
MKISPNEPDPRRFVGRNRPFIKVPLGSGPLGPPSAAIFSSFAPRFHFRCFCGKHTAKEREECQESDHTDRNKMFVLGVTDINKKKQRRYPETCQLEKKPLHRQTTTPTLSANHPTVQE